jgi:hypothetical protein
MELYGDKRGMKLSSTIGINKMHIHLMSKRIPITKEEATSIKEIFSGLKAKNVETLNMVNTNKKMKNNFTTH